MDKIKYDFAFSLGAACASSIALRISRLQFSSLPFDWLAGGDLVGHARLVAEDFRDWLRLEDLELTDVLHATFNSSIYRNRRTGLTFCHDFPAGCYLADEFPLVAAKYARRVRRLYDRIGQAERVLVMYNEIPYRPVAAEAEILAAHRMLQERFPGRRIDLLYFAQDPEGVDRAPRVLNDQVTMVLLDYHSIERGYVGMAAKYHKFVKYLVDRFELKVVPALEAEIAARQAAEERRRRRWGAGVNRWINTRVYHLYRHLERFLARRGCVPSMERPMKLYAERGEHRPSLDMPDISSLPPARAVADHAYDLL